MAVRIIASLFALALSGGAALAQYPNQFIPNAPVLPYQRQTPMFQPPPVQAPTPVWPQRQPVCTVFNYGGGMASVRCM